MSNSRFPGCFKYGCIGCLSIVAVGFGLIFFLSAVQFVSSTDPDPQQRQAEQLLPEAPALPEAPVLPDAAAEPSIPSAEGDQPASIELEALPTPAPPPTPEGVGTLVLDLAMGDFFIQPGPADQPLRVEADYDASRFELEEKWDEGVDGAWSYEVSFGSKSSFFGLMLGGGGEVRNTVTITVPRGHPMNIVGKIKMGESKTDLGGLWLGNFDVDYGMGDHFIEVREPLPFPMATFAAKNSMGQLEIRGLGDASPSRIEVAQSMGDLFLDLTGDWRGNSTIDAKFSMGSCRVWLPEDVFVEIGRGSVAMGEATRNLPDTSELPEDSPRLTLSAHGSMGELVIEH